MKYIFILILVVSLPYFSFAQNLKLKVGGSLTLNHATLSDFIRPLNDNITQSDIVNGTYDSYFQNKEINTLFNTYRSTEPRIGGNINVIAAMRLKSNLSLRLGTSFQLVRLKRVLDRKAVLYDSYSNYPTTAELTDLNFEVPLTALYLTLPFGLQYDFKKSGLSIYGGISFMSRITDRNTEYRKGFIRISEKELFFINPVMEAFSMAFNFGLSYPINSKINIELDAMRGFTNFLGTEEEEIQSSFLQQIAIGVSYNFFDF